ncbi:hypothetical protein B1R32_11413 [Abditibacterium utsteinense]|uniref:Uncharacterized protein n=1 Tax=Abditibacterium utsteinense TaxID=1960156 RepID=A0A2S8SQX8_9BACT|nr:hypothetical protein [Abditibacterium utsteinense]PQV63188.1 hypothetical protein B1R32_11413 [Abditibacterium utsteinense]
MSFWQQLRAALRGQIEDFFRVPRKAVGWMLIVVAILISNAYLRTVYGVSQFFVWRMVLLLVVLMALRTMRRYFP